MPNTPPKLRTVARRHPANPIITPGDHTGPDWRRTNAFNPAVLYEDGKFYLYERTAGQLDPFHCYIGLQTSDDGVHFERVGDEPVFTPEMAGSKYGSVQDPRIVALDGAYYMTFAYRPFAWGSAATGVGVPKSWQVDYPGFDGDDAKNQTQSGIAISHDRLHWKLHAWVSDTSIDDRNVILFPEKINGRYAVLRRPQQFVATDTSHGEPPSVQISFSDDMQSWTDPEPVLRPTLAWENNRIGGSTPPIRTLDGWLVTYHGVEDQDPRTRRVCYRMGAALLDLEDPAKVIARLPAPILEPTEYYEKFGLYIPNVVFPTGGVVVQHELWVYYGCCDTSIGLAMFSVDDLLADLREHGV